MCIYKKKMVKMSLNCMSLVTKKTGFFFSQQIRNRIQNIENIKTKQKGREETFKNEKKMKMKEKRCQCDAAFPPWRETLKVRH